MFLRKSAAKHSKSQKSPSQDSGGQDHRPTSDLRPTGQPEATGPTRSSRPGIPNFPGVSQKTKTMEEPDGSKLVVGADIHLRGEINRCEVLIVEGNVEVAHTGKFVRIAESGRLEGQCTVDIADISGHFDGVLTVRDRLILRPTGRVSGTIRYAQIIIEPGGTLKGDVGEIDASEQDTVSMARQLRDNLAELPSSSDLPQAEPVRPEREIG